MAQGTTEHPNATLFRRGYEPSTRATWTRSASCSTSTSSGTTAAAAGFSHDANGIDETLGFFMELVQASEGTFHLDIHDIVANDDHAVALVTSRQEVGGVKYEDLGSHVVHMNDGKVTESWFFAWNPYQQDELFPA